jgi:hypothetical protein
VLPRATATRFDKAPVEQRSGFAGFRRDDLFRDAPKILSRAIDRKSKRVRDRPVRLGGWFEPTHGIH